jgi:hypothetical protein
MNAISAAAHKSPAKWLLQFVELQVPMVLGALICYLLGRLVPASSSLASAYHPGTYLYATGDILFLTVPVVGWMAIRGFDWQYSLAMAAAMLAPVGLIIAVGQLAGYADLAWLTYADYPVMSLGMAAAMIYSRHEHAHRA